MMNGSKITTNLIMSKVGNFLKISDLNFENSSKIDLASKNYYFNGNLDFLIYFLFYICFKFVLNIVYLFSRFTSEWRLRGDSGVLAKHYGLDIQAYKKH